MLINSVNAGKLSVQTEEITQQMPWPGILSTHPLYKLKILRDNILFSLMSEGINIQQYRLFSSNKLFREMVILYQQGLYDKAYQVGLKSQDYITQFVIQYKLSRDQKILTPSSIEVNFFQLLSQQNIVLTDMIDSVESNEDKSHFQQLQEFLKRNEEGYRTYKTIFD